MSADPITIPGVTFDNTPPDTKTPAGGSFDNTPPELGTVLGVTFDNTAPGAATVPGVSFDGTLPVARTVSGIFVEVHSASRANVTMTTDLRVAGVDNEAMSEGDLCLLKDQDDATENGIYKVAAGTGYPVRADDWDTSTEWHNGCIVHVTDGLSNPDTWWQVTISGTFVFLGTTELYFESIDAAPIIPWRNSAPEAATIPGVTFSDTPPQAIDLEAAALEGLTLPGGDTLTLPGGEVITTP